jgi:serine/threonine-protein kinase
VVETTSARNRWVGRVLRDRWRIDARLARGGVGTVFAATHKNNGNRVAIKLLHPEFSRDEDTRSRFLQEGYAANQVNHPGVVRILDDDTTEEGVAFLVMELLEGELLERRRQRLGGRLEAREVYEVADQLLDVLAAAHEKGIVHRDIKPDNLFLTMEGRLKVLDFGFAQMKTGVRKEQTATGFLLGTPGFMSPEQAVGARGQVDAKTDIWAVGATLFTLLSGLPVHEGESVAEMLIAAANYEARSLATVASHLPPKLVQVVDRALAFDKRARWASARAMKNALLDVPGRLGPGDAPPSSQNPTEGMAGPESGAFFEVPIVVEELHQDDLEEAKASWPEQHTVAASSFDPARFAGVRSPISEPALPVIPRRPSVPAERELLERPTPRQSFHPVDQDGGTLIMNAATTGGFRAMQVPPVAPSSQRPQVPPPRPSYASSPSYGPEALFAPPGPIPGGSALSNEMLFAAPDLPPDLPRDLPRDTPPAQPHAVRPVVRQHGGTRALVLVGVVVFTMVVVVVTGLLVLAASD